MKREELARPIRQAWKSRPTIEGAGVRLRRGFGFEQPHLVDPFLLFDDFRSENPADYQAGFPWHPHRGMETITYILEGEVEHADSLGHRGLITAGDVQWMTSGSGIIHQELPRGDRKGRMQGFQLWSNLPRERKLTEPRYREVKQAEIPLVKTASGASVRVIAGQLDGVRGPVQDVASDPKYLDVSLPAGKTFTHSVPVDHTVFAYVFEGEGSFDALAAPRPRDEAGAGPELLAARSRLLGDGSVILFGAGEKIVVTSRHRPVRFLLVSGKPLAEPIAWRGPIVMNTQEELKTAFDEFQSGTFVKSAKR